MKSLIFTFLCLCAAPLTGVAQTAYDYSRLKMEKLGRGLVAIRQDADTVIVSWRSLKADGDNKTFELRRNGKVIATLGKEAPTYFKDCCRSEEAIRYELSDASIKEAALKETSLKDAAFTLTPHAPHGYLNIPLQKPQGGVTPAGDSYFYTPNDASIGDVDGDGEMEIILKWEPSNAHDNSHTGYTGNVLIDCYRLSGEHLWRIDLGRNIRAGAHYTQFMVYDLDGDGRAEVALRTADGTVDGKGQVIGDAQADYRVHDKQYEGRILTGKEYFTVFNGLTGEAMQSVDYIPQRGDPNDWGDPRANRSDRFLAAVGYLDGEHASVIMCRGYYTRTVLAAYDWDGKRITTRWVFDTNEPEWKDYAGQGNHNLRVGDVDGDGCDEIIYGSMAVDNDGRGLYNTGMGHGDAMHLTQFFPHNPKLQVWCCHENKRDGSTLRDAATGQVLWQKKSQTDVGRCLAADIDPTHEGVEMWSLNSGGLHAANGDLIAEQVPGLRFNMAVWWDGDLNRELLDKNFVSKYDPQTRSCRTITRFHGATSNNGTKATPCLQADILGDWREEVILRADTDDALRIYLTPYATPYRYPSFLEDVIYRLSVATENVGYNQPTQPGFYFGSDR